MDTNRVIAQLVEAVSKAFEFAWLELDRQDDLIAKYCRNEVTEKDYMDFPFQFPLDPANEVNEGEAPSFERAVNKTVQLTMSDRDKGFKFYEKDFNNRLKRTQLMEWAMKLPALLRHAKRIAMLDVLRLGETSANGYDGVPLFSTAHLVGKNELTWSNLQTTSQAPTGRELSRIIANFYRIPWVLDTSGNPRLYLPISALNPQFSIWISPENEFDWDEIINNSLKPESGFNTENVTRRIVPIADIEVEADLFPDPDERNDYYITMTLNGSKPFILLERDGMAGEQLRVVDGRGTGADDRWCREFWGRSEFGVGENQFMYFQKVKYQAASS